MTETRTVSRRIVVIGAGAVGAGLAAELALRSFPHLLVGRGEQIHRIRSEGLRYVRPDGTRRVHIETSIGVEATAFRPEDLVVIATKTQDVESVAKSLAWKPLGNGDDTTSLPILTLQNGLAAERILLRWFSNVYGGSLNIPARYTKTGEVVSGAAPKIGSLVLGRAPKGLNATAEEIGKLLRELDYLVQLDEDIYRWKTLKLLHSVKNGLEVLQATDEERERLGELLVEEARTVLTAAGWAIADPSERTEDQSGFVIDRSSGIQPGQQSTWQSFARGNSSHEVDFLNGEVVLLGRLHAVPAPANEALQAALGRAGIRGSGPGEVPAAEVLEQIRTHA